MTSLELFAYVILPLGIAAAAVGIGYFYTRGHRNGPGRHLPPGE